MTMLDAAGHAATTALGWGVIGFGWVARDFAVPGLVQAGGRLVALPVPDAAASPFARQMAAFANWLAGGGDAFSLERDLHTLRLLHRAYADAEAR